MADVDLTDPTLVTSADNTWQLIGLKGDLSREERITKANFLGNQKEFCAGTIQNTGSGFVFLDDDDHEPNGFDAAGIVNDPTNVFIPWDASVSVTELGGYIAAPASHYVRSGLQVAVLPEIAGLRLFFSGVRIMTKVTITAPATPSFSQAEGRGFNTSSGFLLDSDGKITLQHWPLTTGASIQASTANITVVNQEYWAVKVDLVDAETLSFYLHDGSSVVSQASMPANTTFHVTRHAAGYIDPADLTQANYGTAARINLLGRHNTAI